MSEVAITLIASLIWAVIDFKAAQVVRDNNEGFKAEPMLYALGAILIGGLWPLLFLGGKYLLWKNKQEK